VLTSVTLSRCSRAPVVVPKTTGVGSAGLQQLMGKGVARCMVARPDQARHSDRTSAGSGAIATVAQDAR
jgi:hypothetical protein